MAKKKKVNPHRIPLPKNAINKDKIIEDAMKDDMYHAWLLVIGPLLDAGYELIPLADTVNRYIRFNGGNGRDHEMDRAHSVLGFPSWLLDPSRIKSPVELEAFKRKMEQVAVDTALCVIYLGLEKTIDTAELKKIFFSADLTRAEIEHGLISYEELELNLTGRVKDMKRIRIED